MFSNIKAILQILFVIVCIMLVIGIVYVGSVIGGVVIAAFLLYVLVKDYQDHVSKS